jgi:hypothetical protein
VVRARQNKNNRRGDGRNDEFWSHPYSRHACSRLGHAGEEFVMNSETAREKIRIDARILMLSQDPDVSFDQLRSLGE